MSDEVIPGDVAELHQSADVLIRMGHGYSTAAAAVQGLDRWRGAAADAARESLKKNVRDKLEDLGVSCSTAGRALDRYATVLEAAQQRGREIQAEQERLQQQAEQAAQRHNQAIEQFNAGQGADPGPWQDPTAQTRQQLQAELQQVRAEVQAAAQEAVTGLRQAIEQLPPMPDEGTRLRADLALSLAGHVGVTQDASRALVGMGFELWDLGKQAVSDPIGTASTVAMGLWDTVTDPVGTAKSWVSDFQRDPVGTTVGTIAGGGVIGGLGKGLVKGAVKKGRKVADTRRSRRDWGGERYDRALADWIEDRARRVHQPRPDPTPQVEDAKPERFKSAREELFEQQRAEQLQQPRPRSATSPPPNPEAIMESIQRAERARADIIAYARQYPPDHNMRKTLEAERESLEREIDRHLKRLRAARDDYSGS